MNQSRIIYPLLLLVIFASSFGLSFALTPVSQTGGLLSPAVTPKETKESATGIVIDPSEPKDQTCPLNGAKYTLTEKKIWDVRTPIVAMIENAVDARPQSGLSAADVIYEAVAEGGITRFMAVFYCDVANAAKVAPVRSARIYFVNLAAEYNKPIYLHVGGGNCSRDEASGQCTSDKRAWALEELQKMGWRKAGGNDFDTTFDIGAPVLIRDYNRLGPDRELATEHTMVGNLTAAWREGDKRALYADIKAGTPWTTKFQPWKFTDGAAEDKRGNVASINFEFWKNWPDYTVSWQYDKAANSYTRSTGTEKHLDLENNLPLIAKNIVIQFAKETGPIDDHKHLLYEVVGQGKALVFQNGQVIDATWKKTAQNARTVFVNKQGREIEFVRGQTWIEILPANNTVTYQ